MTRRPSFAALPVSPEQVSQAADSLFSVSRPDTLAALAALGEELSDLSATLITSGTLTQEMIAQYLRDLRIHIAHLTPPNGGSELQTRILQMLGRLPDEIGANYLAERLNMSRSAIDVALQQLVRSGRIARIERNRKGFYSLNEASKDFRASPGTPMVHTASRPRSMKRGASFKFLRKGL